MRPGTGWLLALCVTGLTGPAGAAMFSISFTDAADFGFNDTSRVEPAPGNSAQTLGLQRRAVLQAALDIWASRLDSAGVIRIEAGFDDLGCGEDTTLGIGGTLGLARNFNNAPLADTNYPISLATALRGQFFSQFSSEIRVQFNFRIDDEDCNENIDGFWYGLDPEQPPAIGTASFLELVLHEIGHGLGVQSLTDPTTRAFLGQPPTPDASSRFIFGINQNLAWSEMSAAQRVQTATSGSNLVWTGPQTNLRAAEILLPPGQITIDPGGDQAERLNAFVQGFPPYLPITGLTSTLVLAQGAGPGPVAGDPWHRSLACQALDNPDQTRNKLVLVRRGECLFATKWQNVYQAGGVGMVLADNQPEDSANSINRDFSVGLDRNLPIVLWSVGQGVGERLLEALPDRTVQLAYDPQAAARGTRNGFVNLQATVENPESNVSHLATSLAPRSLMNPSLTNLSYAGNLDQIPEFLIDIGWPDQRAKRAQYSGNWFNPGRSGEGCQLTYEDGQDIPVLTCYLYRDGEQFWLIGNGVDLGDRHEFAEMIITSGADFGSAFDANEVIRVVWGGIRMRPIDCNQARFDFLPNDPQLTAFSSHMVKIVPGDCNRRAFEQPERGRAGNYFDPERSGEGVQLALEADGLTWVLTFYTYLDGRQVWLIGSTIEIGNRLRFNEMILTRGGDFGLAFDPDRIERLVFGEIVIDAFTCNSLRLAIDPLLPEFEAGERTLTRIVPRPC